MKHLYTIKRGSTYTDLNISKKAVIAAVDRYASSGMRLLSMEVFKHGGGR